MKALYTALAVIVLAAGAPSGFGAAGRVTPGQPFPTNLLTAPDPDQLTGLRVDLPKPDCSTRPSDCADVELLNTLDGFNVDPRISIPFSGAIDLSTVSSDTVFLADASGDRVGINKVVWEQAADTLHAEPDHSLRQDTTYVLVVTDGVKAADGGELDASAFRRDLNFGQTKDEQTKAYRKSLIDALGWAGVAPGHVVDASLFTTQSVTAISEKIRYQIDTSVPPPATFAIGSNGERAVFPLATIGPITIRRQTTTAPGFDTSSGSFGGFLQGVGTIAMGRFRSPDYETADLQIPSYPTRTGVPVVQSSNDLYFTLYLPHGSEPAGGWPVAIFGHGVPAAKEDALLAAPVMARNGLALIAINAVGNGGGPLGTMTVSRTDGPPVTVPLGGRSVDQNGDGTIDPFEGFFTPPIGGLLLARDGSRQTAIDLMQLVREIQVGVDVDGDGRPDLNASRISYFGQSFGSDYGAQLLALDPSVHEGVLNDGGGPTLEAWRLSPVNRLFVGLSLLLRSPSLFDGDPGDLTGFAEDLPLRDQPPLVDATPGASAIQEFLDRSAWAQNPGMGIAYAPDLRPQAVIVQLAKGDQTVPNPATSAFVRDGGLQARTTYFRNDLALANVPGYHIHDPHDFLLSVANAPAQFAIAAQQQVATFFASDGATTIDPDGPGPYFETPIAGPLPETLNFS
jgi:Big-like domain-containing protein